MCSQNGTSQFETDPRSQHLTISSCNNCYDANLRKLWWLVSSMHGRCPIRAEVIQRYFIDPTALLAVRSTQGVYSNVYPAVSRYETGHFETMGCVVEGQRAILWISSDVGWQDRLTTSEKWCSGDNCKLQMADKKRRQTGWVDHKYPTLE